MHINHSGLRLLPEIKRAVHGVTHSLKGQVPNFLWRDNQGFFDMPRSSVPQGSGSSSFRLGSFGRRFGDFAKRIFGEVSMTRKRDFRSGERKNLNKILTFKSLRGDQLAENDQMFRDFIALYMEAFPADERRNEDQQRRLLNEYNNYSCQLVYDDDRFIGFIAYWNLDNTALIEHMAVETSLRNQGLGSQMLGQFLQDFSMPVILEVERPGSTSFAARRIGLYQRLGFHLNSYDYAQPPYSSDKDSVPMFIMSHPHPLSPAEYPSLRSLIYRDVYHIDESGGGYE